MVEANQGDGLVRRTQYATFRKDKAPTPGYSAELVSDRVDPKYYDDLGAQPKPPNSRDDLLATFKRNVENRPDAPFLGTRPLLDQLDARGKPQFGPYEWKSFADVDRLSQNFAKGMMNLDLAPEVTGED
mmetsp:Transcript_20341/g.27503  ORF Transcript_20341/g.27503 Transcript_20341/m.27503 type:complete len:129 (-) Transcript_20341:2017-2403(-)